MLETKERIVIEIRKPYQKSSKKFAKALDILMKAFNKRILSPKSYRKEISPYRSERELEDRSKERVETSLLELHREICQKWLGLSKASSDFKLDGSIFINPQTGKALTKAEWKIIKDNITKAFGFIYGKEETRVVRTAMALGKILKKMGTKAAIGTPLREIRLTSLAVAKELTDLPYRAALQFAEERVGEDIVELTARQYKKIHHTLLNAIQDRNTPKQLESKLFDNFADLNRDWRRIAETEIGNSVNNGQLIAEMQATISGEYTYMQGISSAGACGFCRSEIDGEIVVMLIEPPTEGDDQIRIGDKTYTAIWPGKNNVGRKRADWWVAAGTQHPHCLLPDQVVSVALPSSIFKGFYKGAVIEITTACGHKLTVTENHPILTPYGFVMAKFLREGNNVISSTFPDRIMETICPDYHNVPTTIENLYTSALHSSSVPSTFVPVTTKDFHGDGGCMDGKINIVNAYGLLGSNFETLLLKIREELGFSNIDNLSSFIVQSTGLQALTRDSASTPSVISNFSEFLSFLKRSVGHSSKHSFRSISNSNFRFDQSLIKGRATHSEFSREFLNRFTSNIPLDDTIGEVGITTGSSTFLITDKIVHVNSYIYEGNVYDITDDIYGLYIGNGVVVKNCRCSWVRYESGFEEADALLRDAIAEAEKKAKEHTIPEYLG